jgi:hypothetical protein
MIICFLGRLVLYLFLPEFILVLYICLFVGGVGRAAAELSGELKGQDQGELGELKNQLPYHIDNTV